MLLAVILSQPHPSIITEGFYGTMNNNKLAGHFLAHPSCMAAFRRWGDGVDCNKLLSLWLIWEFNDPKGRTWSRLGVCVTGDMTEGLRKRPTPDESSDSSLNTTLREQGRCWMTKDSPSPPWCTSVVIPSLFNVSTIWRIKDVPPPI